ncbi:MAG: TolA-binding protein [Verrucomicrobiales bacterium]
MTGELVATADVDVNNSSITIFPVSGAEHIVANYADEENTTGALAEHGDEAQLLGNASLTATDSAYEDAVEKLQVGERVYLRLIDPDKDTSGERDRVTIEVATSHGESETLSLEENLSHSGVFTGSFKLKAQTQPTPNNFDPAEPQIEAFFGEQLLARYVDDRPSMQDTEFPHETEVPVSDGTDGDVAAFTKMFGDEDLAIQTQFHIAESYFELFKSHLELERDDEANADLKNGRRILKELQEDYPDPKYAPRVSYLLGQYAQELKDWDEAILSYELIVRQFPDHSLAADAQYKLGQCYEEAQRFDDALEAYVTLAATYPENPLISNVMIRINEYFYRDEDFIVAAQVGEKFLDRFESHEWAPRMAFRVGQCFYKAEEFVTAGLAFDDFMKRFPEDDLSPQALFWSGESYREANNVPFAFRRYNRCRWDFPESDAAKFARGRLALPEMLAQFEREAQGVENEQ